MAIFESVYAGSGAGIIYGVPTILVQNPRIQRTFIRDSGRDIVVAQPSGSTAYFDMLNSRYIIGPSGWNANGYYH